jgi:hypothetical protein
MPKVSEYYANDDSIPVLISAFGSNEVKSQINGLR